MRSLRFIKGNYELLGFGFVLTFFSSFGQTFLISLYVPSILEEFSLSNSLFGSLYAGATVMSAICLTFFGKLIDRYPLKKYTAVVLAGLAVSLFFISLIPAHYLWLLPGLFLLRFFGQGMMGHTAITSMARYFEYARGRAISLAAMGHPAGEVAFPVLVTALIGMVGWRTNFQLSALLVLVMAFPLVFLLLRRKHLPAPEVDDPQMEGEKAVSQKEVLTSRAFTVIAPNVFTVPFAVTALFFYQLPLAMEKGWTEEYMALSFTSFAVAGSVSTLLGGMLVDRYSARQLFPWYLGPMVVGVFLMSTTTAHWVSWVFFISIGLSMGMGNTIKSALQAEIFGTRSIGAVRSLFTTLMVFSTAVGPLVFGLLLDAGYDFDRILQMLAAFILLIHIQSFRIRRLKE